MSLNLITTPLDSATLDSKEQYKLYYQIINHVLDEFGDVIDDEWSGKKICTKEEIKTLESYCDRLLFSIKAMQLKYRFDEERMKIDLTESGFPNYLEFRYVHNDLDLKEEFINKLPPSDYFKDHFLNKLMRDKVHIKEKDLFKAASSLYFNTISKEKLFNKFLIGNIKKTKSTAASYVIDWAFYDVTLNRPFVCFMYFDYKYSEAVEKKLYETLKEAADRYMDLDAMAYMIDKRLKEVHPRKVKRVDIGILHSIFSKGENTVTHELLKAIAQKDVPLNAFALSTTIDTITSIKSSKVSNELLSFKKQEIQVWSEVASQKYVFAPHRVIQLMYSNIPDDIINLSNAPFEIEELPENT